ncbi:hypothetical protein [Bdellovibrio svalbardensis]|uniref:Prepilin-type N-terminal cleavage/methylation domain-containing protein n=1 Tax=Bdellovibrio svalbardensis TaxID=2972972 RepID=A0ABT6DI77_9BACT|nr:hypothetical protein [Bdellovibrio svalbardensis]MDG0815551.1 hypothetical protein [Bdellovibrio svalbardensis]
MEFFSGDKNKDYLKSMNNKGFTLTEIAVCVGLTGFMLFILMVPQLEIQKHYRQNESKISRVLENQNLEQKMSSSDFSLDISARVSLINDDLCPCVMGGNMKSDGANICSKSFCTADVATDFVFYDPNSKPIPPSLLPPLIPLSGTAANPAYFDINGAPCTPNTSVPSNCAYTYSTKFTAHCPASLPQCDHADYLTIELVATPIGTQKLAETRKKIIYPIKLNYPPILATIADQTLPMPFAKQIAVNSNSGSPTENQDFVFQECKSSDTNVVEVKCYRFINSIGQMILTPKASGVASISIQVNDGGAVNNLSNILTFKTTVTP